MQTRWQRYSMLGTCLACAVVVVTAHADVSITLKNSFIAKNKNRATLAAQYSVAHTHHRAKSASQDGDIHCAGTAPEVGLACVAEVMNAKDQPAAVKAIVDAEQGAPIELEGVWRLWPEHAGGGGDEFVQGNPVDEIVDTNPPHVFEIHPLVTVAGHDVRSSFKPVVGYQYKDAATAFGKFESWPCRVIAHKDSTEFVTNQIGYNYVAFTLELLEDPLKPNGQPTHALEDDGMSVYATAPGPDSETPLASKVRCIFVTGTAPDTRVRKLKAGGRMRVIGVPRVDLALMAYRAQHAQDRPELLTRSLPYEMIIVAVQAGP